MGDFVVAGGWVGGKEALAVVFAEELSVCLFDVAEASELAFVGVVVAVSVAIGGYESGSADGVVGFDSFDYVDGER